MLAVSDGPLLGRRLGHNQESHPGVRPPPIHDSPRSGRQCDPLQAGFGRGRQSVSSGCHPSARTWLGHAHAGWRSVAHLGQVTEEKIQIRRRHGQGLRLDPIRSRLEDALNSVTSDRERMWNWEQEKVQIGDIDEWTREHVATRWNRQAAARVFYICTQGCDVEIAHPFEKPSEFLPVPGSPQSAESVYDVSQALSFVATRRRDVEERVKWQEDIPRLLEELPATRQVDVQE